MAADALVDLRNVDRSTVNLAHPFPVPCGDIIQTFSQELSLPIVSYEAWVKKLDAVTVDSSPADAARSTRLAMEIPATKIIGFFHDVLRAVVSGKEDGEAMGIARLSVEEAKKGSVSLRSVPKLCPDDVRLWLLYWRNVGFIL